MSYSTSLDDLLGPENNSTSQQMPPMQQQQQQQMSPMQQQHIPPVMNPNKLVDDILTELDNSSIPENTGFEDANNNAHYMNYATQQEAYIQQPDDRQILETQELLKADDTQTVMDLNNKLSYNNNDSVIKTSYFNISTSLVYHLLIIVIFSIIYFVSSLYYINSVLFKFFPYLIEENGRISYKGLLLKSLFMTLIFSLSLYILNYLY